MVLILWKKNSGQVQLKVMWYGSRNGAQYNQSNCCQSTFIIKVNDKICPTSTANININTPSTLNPTTKVTQHQHKFSWSAALANHIKTNTVKKLQVEQQNTFNNLGTSDWKWPRDLGTYIFIPLTAVAIFSEDTTLEQRGISSANTFIYWQSRCAHETTNLEG